MFLFLVICTLCVFNYSSYCDENIDECNILVQVFTKDGAGVNSFRNQQEGCRGQK